MSSADHQHRTIYLYREHEHEVTELLTQIVEPGMVVYDVGANVGFFTLTARDLGATVHAFEPNPVVAALLEKSLSWNPERVTLVQAAVSVTSGDVVPLYLSEPGNTGMTSLDRPTDRQVRVPTVKLDDYAAAHAAPSIIKIDVEGHQLSVLEGAREVLSAARPDVILETEGHDEIELLASLGYSPFTLAGGAFRPFTGAIDGYANLLFRHDQR